MSSTKIKILTQAIVKAVKNGYYADLKGRKWEVKETSSDLEVLVYECKHDNKYKRYDSKTIIFSHPFAKAFWGEEDYTDDNKSWEWHLTVMVLEKDPILYLKKFL